MVSTSVIAAAGKGTRLMPATKEQPKEMLPIVSQGVMKPILHLIVEQLYTSGINKLFVITGRDKRAVVDYFIQNYELIDELSNKADIKSMLQDFYNILSKINISYINQPRPEGFGAAVHLAENYISSSDSFFLTSGDSIVFSLQKGHSTDFIKRLTDAHEKYDADATLAFFKAEDVSKYGVIVGGGDGNIIDVAKVIEKPKEPVSNLAIVGKYVFKPVIFHALKKIGFGVGQEKQLTDAIQWLIEKGFKVIAIPLKKDEVYLDIGNPQTYMEALLTTALSDPILKSIAIRKFNELNNFYKISGENNDR